MKKVVWCPPEYRRVIHDCSACPKTHFKFHLDGSGTCSLYMNTLSACSLGSGVAFCTGLPCERVRIRLLPTLTCRVRNAASKLLHRFGFAMCAPNVYESCETLQPIGTEVSQRVRDDSKAYALHNRYGRIVQVGDAEAISQLDFARGRIRFDRLKISTEFFCHPKEEDMYVRFFLSKPLSPIIYQLRITPNCGSSVPMEITLDFPLGEAVANLSGKDISERYLNVWAFSHFTNEKSVMCVNPSGVSNTQIAKIYNWSLLDGESKKNMHICRTNVVMTYVSEGDIRAPTKGIIDFVGIGNFESTLVEKITPNPHEHLYLSSVAGAYPYCYSIKNWFDTQIEPSYSFMKSIHAYSYITNGKCPAALFWLMNMHKPADKTLEFPLDKGNVTFTGRYHLEKMLWIHLLRLSARRFFPGADQTNTLLSRVIPSELGNILGTALTLYSNYCQYIPDMVYAPVVNGRSSSTKTLKISIERFDRQCGRDGCDCEDGACYVNYLVTILRAVFQDMKGTTPMNDDDRILLKFGEFLDKYYAFTCVAAVSDSSYSDSEQDIGMVTDEELRKHQVMQAHAFAVLIPKSDVYVMLSKLADKNQLVLKETDKLLGVGFPVLFCETTGNLVPVAVKDPLVLNNYGGLGDLMGFLDGYRPLNALDENRSGFYRAMSTLMTPDFHDLGIYEFVLLLKRKGGRSSASSQWTYGVPYSNIVSGELETSKVSVGMMAQKPIPVEVMKNSRELLENDYPLSTIVPADQDMLNLSRAGDSVTGARDKMGRLKSMAGSSVKDPGTINRTDYKCYTTFIPYQEVDQAYDLLKKLIQVMKHNSLVDITEEPVCLSYDGKSVVGGYIVTVATRNRIVTD